MAAIPVEEERNKVLSIQCRRHNTSIHGLESILRAEVYSVEEKDELEQCAASPNVTKYYYTPFVNGCTGSYMGFSTKLEEVKHQCLLTLPRNTLDHGTFHATKKMLQKLHGNMMFCLENLGTWGAIQEIASGLVDISAIYESMNETDQALKLLQKAVKVYGDISGQQSIIAGIEAQIGVLYYILGSHSDSYNSLRNSIANFRAIGEKKSAVFGVALNQIWLASLQFHSLKDAANLFEEARSILEVDCRPYHVDTLGVYSNLSAVYDALGRTNDAIEVLEHVVELREEKVGTANPDVNDKKRRLTELLKSAGRVRTYKSRSLKTLLDSSSYMTKKEHRSKKALETIPDNTDTHHHAATNHEIMAL